MNIQNRGEGYFPGSFFRRSERVVVDDSGYHFRTRQGETVGPFLTESDANLNLGLYLKTQTHQKLKY